MTPPNDAHWQDLVARRPLTADERRALAAWVRANPAAADRWADELALSEALRQLPPAPLPSHFVARVLAEVRRAQPVPRRVRPFDWLRWWTDWRHALPLATAVAALALTLAIQAHHRAQVRTELAEGLAALPIEGLAQLPFWQDFDPIQVLPEGPLPSGRDLAAALE
jgi:anti-sigma factor RsiW